MCHDVATDWLLWINCVSHSTTRVSCNLVSYEDSNIELLTDFLQLAHHSIKDLLSLSEFSSARVVHSERRHDGVHYQQCKLVFNHLSCCLHQECDQAVHSEGPSHEDVVEDLLSIQVESDGDGLDSLWSECVLGVDVENLALASTLRSWQLCSDTESMTKLGLACPELSKCLCDRHTLHTTLEELIKRIRPS